MSHVPFRMIEHSPVLEHPGQLFDIAKWARDELKMNPWFRGHGRASWYLHPSVYREESGWYKYDKLAEMSSYLEFRRRALSRYTRCPNNDDPAGWLFLMQHYGLRTRLLDWTESIQVAAYFATLASDGERDVHDAVIWVLSPKELNTSEIRLPGTGTPLDAFHRDAFAAAFGGDKPAITAVAPDEVDSRLQVQQSCFTLHGRGVPLQDLASHERFLRRVLIPASARQAVNDGLMAVGVHQATLFPDLHSLACHINQRMRFPGSVG